jgi:5-dehydro-2-deoxygluconokinase
MRRQRRSLARNGSIYDGFLAALAGGVPKENAGILVDEQLGALILRDAASENVITACPTEKSGQAECGFVRVD